jgi:hypothetical protein
MPRGRLTGYMPVVLKKPMIKRQTRTKSALQPRFLAHASNVRSCATAETPAGRFDGRLLGSTCRHRPRSSAAEATRSRHDRIDLP